MIVRRILLNLLLMSVIIGLNGCAEDDVYHKLSGQWEGQNSNNSTGKQWNFELTVEHRGRDITGYYSDYRGGRTLRNITYNGESLGFLIDLWPDTVTFYGFIDTKNSMTGTWSFSGDDNNGTWYLLRNQDPDSEDDGEDESEDSSENYFARH